MRQPPLALSARLNHAITLEVQAGGKIAATFEGNSIGLGTFSADTAGRAPELRRGIPLAAFTDGKHREIELLVRRLAQRGLIEYRLGGLREESDLAVIEPQMPDYWPRMTKLGDADLIALSRFAYLRRRGHDMVLESPRADALFRIGNPKIASALAMLATPQRIRKLRQLEGFPDLALLALLVDCQMIFKLDATDSEQLRSSEGDDKLVLWDFHDLLFHTRSTAGRQANPLGGLYPFADLVPAAPAVRPRWPGRKIDLRKFPGPDSGTISPLATLLRMRHSTRDFDSRHPITLTELARFLDGSARIQSKWKSSIDPREGAPAISYAARPYPAGGAGYELELYLAVANCEGLQKGFYHYDADQHALVSIAVSAPALDACLASAAFAMDAASEPQVLVTIAARFDRISWKYSSIAYSLILKDVGVLIQTLYLMATDMGLGGCAIGSIDIDLFAKMTGIEFHIEGPVGQFAMGRGTHQEVPR